MSEHTDGIKRIEFWQSHLEKRGLASSEEVWVVEVEKEKKGERGDVVLPVKLVPTFVAPPPPLD